MKRIIAVLVEDTPQGKVIHGFTSRGKNRKRAWTCAIEGLSNPEVRQVVEDAEFARKQAELLLGEYSGNSTR